MTTTELTKEELREQLDILLGKNTGKDFYRNQRLETAKEDLEWRNERKAERKKARQDFLDREMVKRLEKEERRQVAKKLIEDSNEDQLARIAHRRLTGEAIDTERLRKYVLDNEGKIFIGRITTDELLERALALPVRERGQKVRRELNKVMRDLDYTRIHGTRDVELTQEERKNQWDARELLLSAQSRLNTARDRAAWWNQLPKSHRALIDDPLKITKTETGSFWVKNTYDNTYLPSLINTPINPNSGVKSRPIPRYAKGSLAARDAYIKRGVTFELDSIPKSAQHPSPNTPRPIAKAPPPKVPKHTVTEPLPPPPDLPQVDYTAIMAALKKYDDEIGLPDKDLDHRAIYKLGIPGLNSFVAVPEAKARGMLEAMGFNKEAVIPCRYWRKPTPKRLPPALPEPEIDDWA